MTGLQNLSYRYQNAADVVLKKVVFSSSLSRDYVKLFNEFQLSFDQNNGLRWDVLFYYRFAKKNRTF